VPQRRQPAEFVVEGLSLFISINQWSLKKL
jgi:hypothetical protein